MLVSSGLCCGVLMCFGLCWSVLRCVVLSYGELLCVEMLLGCVVVCRCVLLYTDVSWEVMWCVVCCVVWCGVLLCCSLPKYYLLHYCDLCHDKYEQNARLQVSLEHKKVYYWRMVPVECVIKISSYYILVISSYFSKWKCVSVILHPSPLWQYIC